MDSCGPSCGCSSKRSFHWGALLLGLTFIALAAYQFFHSSFDTSWIDRPLAFGDAPVTVRIERGMSARAIGRVLVHEGVLPSELRFRQLIKATGGANRLQAGVFHVAPTMTGRDLIKLLQSGAGGIRVTIPEGWTSPQIAAALVSAELIASPASFEAAIVSEANRPAWASARESLEGYLYPDTYLFLPDMTSAEIVAEMVRGFGHAVNVAAYRASAEAEGLTLDEAVILASIIEREARTDDERPIMAGVFLNRLKRGMKLESCATVNYALGDWSRPLTVADTRIDSPYNTYVIDGLPPGPICNPGLPSLLAAVKPAETDYLFFVYDEALGRHRFSRTFAEHTRAIRAARGG
jgi:UPF0755 protein